MTVTIHEAKTHLFRLIQEALPSRRLGGAAGVVKYMAPDFTDEMEEFWYY